MYVRDGVEYKTYGSYLRAKRLGIMSETSWTEAKEWDSELSYFYDTVKQGIMPDGTKRHQIDRAVQMSDAFGHAYDGADPVGSLGLLDGE